MKISKLFTTLLVFVSSVSFAGNSLTKDIFSDVMTSSNGSGAINSSVSNGYALGGGTYRIRQMHRNLVTVRSPSIKAGCAGVDFFAGSFSVINKDQLIQMGRAVMQGVPGYAFQLALDSICPSCGTEMKHLMDQLSLFNQAAGDSCKLSKALVDKSFGPSLEDKAESYKGKLGTIMSKIGDIPDFGTAMTDWVELEPDENSNQKVKEAVNVNIVAKAYSDAKAGEWFSLYSMSEQEKQGFILAITGTIINLASKSTDSDKGNLKERVKQPLLKMSDLIDNPSGNSISIYQCAASTDPSATVEECLELVEVPKPSWQGLTQLYEEQLLGSSSTVSLTSVIYKLKGGNNSPLTEEQKTFLKKFPFDLKNMFEALGNNITAKVSLARSSAKLMAYLHGIEIAKILDTALTNLLEAPFDNDANRMTLAEKLKLSKATLAQEMKLIGDSIQTEKVAINALTNHFAEVTKQINLRNSVVNQG